MIGSCGIVSCQNTPSKLSGTKQFVPAARIYDNIILLFMCILNNFYIKFFPRINIPYWSKRKPIGHMRSTRSNGWPKSINFTHPNNSWLLRNRWGIHNNPYTPHNLWTSLIVFNKRVWVEWFMHSLMCSLFVVVLSRIAKGGDC